MGKILATMGGRLMGWELSRLESSTMGRLQPLHFFFRPAVLLPVPVMFLFCPKALGNRFAASRSKWVKQMLRPDPSERQMRSLLSSDVGVLGVWCLRDLVLECAGRSWRRRRRSASRSGSGKQHGLLTNNVG